MQWWTVVDAMVVDAIVHAMLDAIVVDAIVVDAIVHTMLDAIVVDARVVDSIVVDARVHVMVPFIAHGKLSTQHLQERFIRCRCTLTRSRTDQATSVSSW